MIKTTNISTEGSSTGGFVRKSFNPGNHSLKINDIFLEKSRFTDRVTGVEEFNLVFYMETMPVGGDFEGFSTVKDNPTAPKFLGQVGIVKSQQFSYKDYTPASGTLIPRDTNLLRDIKLLTDALGITQWLLNQDGKHATVESLVAALNKEKPFKDKYLYYCVAAREYLNQKGFVAFEMYLPSPSTLGKPYDVNQERVQKFFESVHIKKASPKGGTNLPPVTPQIAPVANVKELSKEEKMKVAQAAMKVPANPATPITNSFENGQVEEEDDFLRSLNEPIANDIVRGGEEPEFVL